MKTEYAEMLEKPNVIGVVTRPEDVSVARMSSPDQIDGFEIRLDHWLYSIQSKHTQALINLGRPLIVTPRDQSEGGVRQDWTIGDRMKLYREWLPYATFIDIEVAEAGKYAEIINRARDIGVGIILSHHNLMRASSMHTLTNAANDCNRLRGNVFKIAMRVVSEQDADLLDMAARTIRLAWGHSFKLSAMPIGEEWADLRFRDAAYGGPFIYCGLSTKMPGQPWAVKAKRELETYCSGWSKAGTALVSR